MSDLRAIYLLEQMYRELPTIDCQRKCDEACGPIYMTRVEWQRITKKCGHEPKAASLTCPLLRNGMCSVHAIRPTICRLWGIVETMPCPWGCKPSPRYLTHEEGHEFLRRAREISGP